MTSISDEDYDSEPGRDRLVRRVQLMLVLIGLSVAGYLSYLKLEGEQAVCVEAGPFNCDLVLNSLYSELASIPIAYLGFAVYAAIGLILVLERQVGFVREWGRLLSFGIGLFAWLFSMWLVYAQFVLLEALCPWCLTHETNFTVLFALICYRVYRATFSEA